MPANIRYDMEVSDSNKHSSFLRYEINYGRKKFSSTGPVVALNIDLDSVMLNGLQHRSLDSQNSNQSVNQAQQHPV